uniref:G patch domain-containing protein 11 n=1 Tax=Caligus clemensi TaxID=344056 RepID=C1C0X1_CALCM|nr:Coiled-coil domain-containing protein 75 [Caligus clemensi]
MGDKAEEEEVDDYMSDNFVSEDVRPGLPMTYAKKRIHDIKKIQAKVPKLSERESSVREDGLSKALDSSNKGFSMLAKMGFKPGSSLGKTSSGIKEPIGINLKTSREGLGRENHLKEKHVSSQKVVLEDFQKRIRDHSKNRYLEFDVRKSQKSILDLDSKEGLSDPIELWYWPPKPKERLLVDDEEESGSSEDKAAGESELKEEEEEEEEVVDHQERLNTLTKYLRTKYFYCIWCADKYKDDDEMRQHCPGNSRDSHEDGDLSS